MATAETGGSSSGSDPFATALIRARVLDAWSASPVRFREDANAEEDLVVGSYRDRLAVELAQNAADAAASAGVPGRVRFAVVGDELRVANVGAALDADGVTGLSTLRVSAKRGSAVVGRFGVGFAAALAVSDAPAVLSAGGGVAFSAERTRAAVGAVPALADELNNRSGAVPVLRLPWPDDRPPPEGFDTEIRLPLRPGVREAVDEALAAVDLRLLLALPGLSYVDVNGRVLERVESAAIGDAVQTLRLRDADRSSTWLVHCREVAPPDALLSARGVEERQRSTSSITWAVETTEGEVALSTVAGRVLAPTPTDDELTLPAVLVADLPLGPDRRRVAPGALTDWLLAAAADGYAELVAALPEGPGRLAMVPRPSLTRGGIDGTLCAAVLTALRAAPWLPKNAAVCDAPLAGLAELMGQVRDGVLNADWSDQRHRAALDVLGVQRLALPDIVELLTAVQRPPHWWRLIYDALDGAGVRAVSSEELATLPVPLADGRRSIGARATMLADPELFDAVPADALRLLQVRVVHPSAVHPLLERLGAHHATPRSVLVEPHLRTLVAESLDSENSADSDALVEAVLGLVKMCRVEPGELPFLADLALSTEDGDRAAAGELLMPDSALNSVMCEDSPFGTVAPELVKRWGADVLAGVGVLDTFAVVREVDVDIPADTADDAADDHDLDAEADWAREVCAGGGVLDEFVAVRDLELVAPSAWPEALDQLSTGELRSAVAAEARWSPSNPAAGGPRVVASYTRWWLARFATIGGVPPRRLRLAGAVDLVGLFDEAEGEDEEWLTLIGVRAGLDGVLPAADAAADPEDVPPDLVETVQDLLERLGDRSRRCPHATLAAIYARLDDWAERAPQLLDLDPPSRLRTAPARVIAAEDAIVVDRPYLLDLVPAENVVVGGAALADLLDVSLASEEVQGRVDDDAGTQVCGWADIGGAAFAAERLGEVVPTAEVYEHARLAVDGREVAWWTESDRDHVNGFLQGRDRAAALGKALAWRWNRWPDRSRVIEALMFADREGDLRAEDCWH